MSGDATLYEEVFSITTVVDDKYERVNRVIGTSSDNATSLTLDVNSELYPLATGDTVSMCLVTTLNLDGTKDERGWRDRKGETSLADLWDYVCYGKVYRFEEGEEGKTMYNHGFSDLNIADSLQKMLRELWRSSSMLGRSASQALTTTNRPHLHAAEEIKPLRVDKMTSTRTM